MSSDGHRVTWFDEMPVNGGTVHIRSRALARPVKLRKARPYDLGPQGTWRTHVRFADGADTVLYWQHFEGARAYVAGVVDEHCPRRRRVDAEGRDWTPLYSPAVVRDWCGEP